MKLGPVDYEKTGQPCLMIEISIGLDAGTEHIKFKHNAAT